MVDTGQQDEYRDAQRSVANEFEVALCKDITSIIRKRVRKAKLAVIAMYLSQVSRLVRSLRGIVPPDDIESVDAFEGRESDAVILSLSVPTSGRRSGPRTTPTASTSQSRGAPSSW